MAANGTKDFLATWTLAFPSALCTIVGIVNSTAWCTYAVKGTVTGNTVAVRNQTNTQVNAGCRALAIGY